MDFYQALYLLHGWLEGLARPRRARIVGPEFFDRNTGKTIKMPQALQNDVISVLHVVFDNLAGQPVPPPAGGTTAVSLVDATGAASPLGTAQIGSPDGTGMDGSKISVIPVSPPPLGDAFVQYDDSGPTAGTQDDISFSYGITFTPDLNATSAHVDPTVIETFPLPAP